MLASRPERACNLETFRQGLRDLGWAEGQNLTMQCATGGRRAVPQLGGRPARRAAL